MGILIAGVSSGSGKTTLTLGLMRALKNRGLAVGAFKAGPDYIDPMFHRIAISGPSYNLPGWMLEDEVIQYLYHKRTQSTEIDVIEGVMGYYDGHTTDSILGSSAHLAETIGADTLLIIDGSGMALTAAAVIDGMVSFHKPSRIKGVIFNKVKSTHHYALLKEAVEKHVGIPCFGYLCPNQEIVLESRHLGLVQAQETYKIDEKIEKMAQWVEATVDVEGIIRRFKKNVDPQRVFGYDVDGDMSRFIEAKIAGLRCEAKDLVIGYASDLAFSFYYDENLMTLKELGVILKPFSPMYDLKLPDGCKALYLGGGYPEVFAKELSLNQSMIDAIRRFGESGQPIYAECGGYMYMTNSITTIEGVTYPMVGLLDAHALMTDRLQHFGHVEATLTGLSEPQVHYKGHEFHHSIIESNMPAPEYLISVKRKSQSWSCGLFSKRTLGTYVHAHFYSHLDFLEALINFWNGFKGDCYENVTTLHADIERGTK